MPTRYRTIQAAAGEGGFGRIDKAFDIELERNVAVKILDPLFRAAPSLDDRERFKREAKTLASLSHPNIPAIYDVEFSDEAGVFKIIFEWIEGISIHRWLLERGVMSLDEVRKWFENICSALEHAHSKGVIHRDIKPSNMIITNSQQTCYVVDFGIALRSADLQRLTQGSPIGTPGYMSPEQERGEEPTPASDIYALGIVLYECLSGSRPSVGEYRSLSVFNESIPPAIDELVRSCLTTNQNERLASAAEFYGRLSRALRPHASFSETLSQGSLYEIQLGLSSMNPVEYAGLPLGQRVLVMARLRDLAHVDQPNMRNAVASLLRELIRVGYRASGRDYEQIISLGLVYGYEKPYTETWIGNNQIREVINKVAIECPASAHAIMCDRLLHFITENPNIEQQQRWYYHDLRILLQNLLANSNCTEEHATQLGDQLDNINRISHQPAALAFG